MPAFIESLDTLDPQLPPPYNLEGVDIHSFAIEADMPSLQALCDERLNIGDANQRGFMYRPLLPYVSLEVLSYAKMSCINFPYSTYGFTPQQELYIRFLVVKYELVLGQPVIPVEVSSFFPFIFVDNNWSAYSGREVIGMAKQLGVIDQNKAGDTTYSATLSLPVTTTRLPTTQQDDEQVVSIQTGIEILGGPVYNWPYSAAGIGGLSAAEVSLIEQVIPLGLLSTIQLKQIRDAEDPTQACFQALVQGEFSVSLPTTEVLYESAQVTFTDFGSLAIAQKLGLSSGDPIDAVLSYRLSCNMLYDNVRYAYIVGGTAAGQTADLETEGDVDDIFGGLARSAEGVLDLWLGVATALLPTRRINRARVVKQRSVSPNVAIRPHPVQFAVTCRTHSRRPVEVTLSPLMLYGSPVNLAVSGLRSSNRQLPAIPRVAFRILDGGKLLVDIHIPDEQPAGFYSGAVIDRISNRPMGTLRVQVLD